MMTRTQLVGSKLIVRGRFTPIVRSLAQPVRLHEVIKEQTERQAVVYELWRVGAFCGCIVWVCQAKV